MATIYPFCRYALTAVSPVVVVVSVVVDVDVDELHNLFESMRDRRVVVDSKALLVDYFSPLD